MSFGLLINHEEKAARKAQEEKLQEWRYNKRIAEMKAQYERDQEKEAKKSRPERDKWNKPLSKEETPLIRTKEKRNRRLKRWLESFKAKIHQKIINPRPSPVLEEDQKAKDIKPELSIVYVRAESMDDQLHQEEDLGLIFDEEEEPEAVSILLAFQKWLKMWLIVDQKLIMKKISQPLMLQVIFSVLYQVPNWFSHLFARSTTQWSY